MAKGDQKDRLTKLRRQPELILIWSGHAEKRLSEYGSSYGLSKLDCERIVRSGALRLPETNVDGEETVHAAGAVDGNALEVVVSVKSTEVGEIVKIVTLKPKKR